MEYVAQDNENMKNGMHIAYLVYAVEYSPGYVADAFGNNPSYHPPANAVVEWLECYQDS